MPKVIIFQHAADVPAGSVVPILAQAGLTAETCRLFENLPHRLPIQEAAGIVVLGGPMSANDTDLHPFLAVELDWMRAAIACDIPLLGLCLGAQMLAKAAGGRVYPHTIREVGWSEVDVLAPGRDDALFQGRQSRETVFQWHGDTFDLPPQAVLLAVSERCHNQAFRVGRCAYGLQFHAEITPEIMREWLQEKPAKIHDRTCGPIDPTAIAGEAVVRFPALNDFSGAVLSRFARLCAEQAASLEHRL